MKRRAYLGAVTAGAVAGTAGCLWEDDGSDPRLALVGVWNYEDRSNRFAVRVEADGEHATTREVELGPGTNRDPSGRYVDCGWSTEPGTFTIELLQLDEPRAFQSVSLPGEWYEDHHGNCVGLDFLVGSNAGGYVAPRFADCEEYVDGVDFCVDVE